MIMADEVPKLKNGGPSLCHFCQRLITRPSMGFSGTGFLPYLIFILKKMAMTYGVPDPDEAKPSKYGWEYMEVGVPLTIYKELTRSSGGFVGTLRACFKEAMRLRGWEGRISQHGETMIAVRTR